MGAAELIITPSEATKLYEEKVQTLRTEMNHVQRSTRDAIDVRDKALHDVQELGKQKAALIEEMAETKQSKQRIMDSLAEHRHNVESSLTKQEKAAFKVIDEAKDREASANEAKRKVLQLAHQVEGLKQTLMAELATITANMAEMLKEINEKLTAIPDTTKS